MQQTMREIEQPLKPFIITFTILSVGTALAAIILTIVQNRRYHLHYDMVMPFFLASCWWILFALIRRAVRQRERPEWRVDEDGLTKISAPGDEDKIPWSQIKRITLTNSGLRLFWKPWGEENFTKRPLSLYLSREGASFIASEWNRNAQS